MFHWSILIISGLLSWPTCADSSWLQPNAWELHSPSSNECPVCDSPIGHNEESIVNSFYRETISQIFNQHLFKKNPKNGLLERTLVFSLTPVQLQIIENGSDLQDLNAIVMLVLKKARELEQVPPTPTPTTENSESSLWMLVSILKYIYSGIALLGRLFFSMYDTGSEGRFAMSVVAVLMTIWFIHKRYNKNLILLLLCAFVMVGYFCTYVECNRKNPINGQLVFSPTPAQLKIIENGSNREDLNAIVTLVLKMARDLEQAPPKPTPTPTPTTINIESLFWLPFTILKYIYSGFSQIVRLLFFIYNSGSEERFAMSVVAVLMTIWFIHKWYKKNLFLVLLGAFIILGYFCTYIECNRKLAAEDYIQFIRDNEPDEPNFFTKHVGKFFKLSAKEEKIEKIKNQSKIKLPFCRPDHVAIMYFNEMFFNQLQVVVEKVVDSMTVIQNKVPFPFNYLGMIALPFLFMSILPLLFQNILNPVSWFRIIQGTTSENVPTQAKTNNNATEGDCLSGENLKNFLNVLKHKNIVEEKTKHSAVEDVQDVPKPIEAKLDESLNDLPPEDDNEKLGESLNDFPRDSVKFNESFIAFAMGTTVELNEGLSETVASWDDGAVLKNRRSKKTYK